MTFCTSCGAVFPEGVEHKCVVEVTTERDVLKELDDIKKIVNTERNEVIVGKVTADSGKIGEAEITAESMIHHGKSFSRGEKIIEVVGGLIVRSPNKKWRLQLSDEGIASWVEVKE